VGPRVVDIAAASRQGRIRGANQDRYRWWADGHLVVLADGMAGRPHGDIAADLALNAIAHHVIRTGLDADAVRAADAVAAESQICHVFALAHRAISASSQHYRVAPPMTTTLLVAWFTADELVIGHVGDSRGYLLDDGRLSRVTKDQRRTPPGFAELADDERNALLSLVCLPDATVGDAARPAPVVTRQPLHADDTVLLCSNGLSDVVGDDVIASYLATGDSAAACSERLVAAAAASNAEDDATAIVVRFRDRPRSTLGEVLRGR
jgi:serine/threonine protein phosphatase PrpC